MVITALSALGDTVYQYRANFIPKNVLEQLKSVETCLGRVEGYFKLYEQGIELDPRLRATVMRIFVATLRLCTIYTKVAQDSTSPTGFVKNIFKAAVGWDGGIASKLEEINAVSQQELNNNVAALRVSDIYTNHNKIRKANSEKLRKYLQINGEGDSWTDRQESLKNESLPEMGDWLFELREVQSWIDIDNHSSNPVLLLEAPSGHGKSHLCSHIIRSLEVQRDKQQQKTRMSLAWYFLRENQTEKGLGSKEKMILSDETERIALNEALKSLVWQLADNNAAFQDSVMKIMQKNPAAAQYEGVNIWTKLVMPFFKSNNQETQKPQMVVFLVLDGYGTLENQNAYQSVIKTIIKNTSYHSKRSIQIRVLLSGNTNFDDACIHKLTTASFFEDNQRLDAKIFIKNRFDELYELWDSRSEGYRIIWVILRDLESKFTGNYHDLEAWLYEVRRSSDKGLSDLYLLQREVRNDAKIITQRKVEMLNEELGSDDIEVFNEIIACMVNWYTWPTVQQLNAYLSLRLGSKFKTSIDAKINEKFARLVSVENGRIVSSTLLELFQKDKTKIKNTSSDMGQREDRQNSHEESVVIPKRFIEYLRNRKPNDDMNTEFLKYLVETHAVSKPVIDLNSAQGNFDTLHFFLQTMGQKKLFERAESNYLFEYTSIWLPKHLSSFSDKLGNLPEETRKDLGEAVYRVFMNEEAVETWILQGDINNFLRAEWPKNMKDASELLKDAGVIMGFRAGAEAFKGYPAIAQQRIQEDVPVVGTSEKESTESMAEYSGEERDIDAEKLEQEHIEGGAKSTTNEQPAIKLHEILDGASRVVASQWLQESRWPAISALRFLLKIFREVGL